MGSIQLDVNETDIGADRINMSFSISVMVDKLLSASLVECSHL